ncbi:MAG: hypothetical protein IPK26_13635 [Planctomycetes bacterium]|nr:hypothetical protein [Planctomycetota bacterium]
MTAPGAAPRLAVPAAPTVLTPAPAGEARQDARCAAAAAWFRQPPRLGVRVRRCHSSCWQSASAARLRVRVTLANPVFAGIGAALGGVGMAFTWIWTRN